MIPACCDWHSRHVLSWTCADWVNMDWDTVSHHPLEGAKSSCQTHTCNHRQSHSKPCPHWPTLSKPPAVQQHWIMSLASFVCFCPVLVFLLSLIHETIPFPILQRSLIHLQTGLLQCGSNRIAGINLWDNTASCPRAPYWPGWSTA